MRSTLAGDGKGGIEKPLPGLVILLSVVVGANDDVRAIEQTGRDGNVRRRVWRGKLRLSRCPARAGRADLVHYQRIGVPAPAFQSEDPIGTRIG